MFLFFRFLRKVDINNSQTLVVIFFLFYLFFSEHRVSLLPTKKRETWNGFYIKKVFSQSYSRLNYSPVGDLSSTRNKNDNL